MTIPARIDGLLSLRSRGGVLILVFDYDGTLVPYESHPSLAVLPPSARGVLEALAGRPRIVLGIVSSRDLEDLKEMVRLPGICSCGMGGLEYDLRGRREVHPEAESFRGLIDRVSGILEEGIREFAGAWVERKGAGVAVHYRNLDRGSAEALRERALRILEPFRRDLRILDHAMALEATPAAAWTKGHAIRRIHETFAAGETGLLYAGDEANDAEAFEAAASLGGIALGIGPRAPASAAHRLPDPAALMDLLADMLRRIDRDPGAA